MIALNEPLSDQEIAELDEFLMSDATPEESMSVVEVDGFLTSLVIGPEVVPPSVWLKTIWGGEDEPKFESVAEAQRVISLIMRRFNTLSLLFEEPPEFAPILWEREVEGTTYRIADDWCMGSCRMFRAGRLDQPKPRRAHRLQALALKVKPHQRHLACRRVHARIGDLAQPGPDPRVAGIAA